MSREAFLAALERAAAGWQAGDAAAVGDCNVVTALEANAQRRSAPQDYYG